MSKQRQLPTDRPVDRIKQTLASEAGYPDAPERASRPGRLDSVAVGLVVEDCDPDVLAGAILRAYQTGHHVLVARGSDPGGEALEFARELGATFVDSSVDRDDPVDRLLTAARRLGFPGLVYHDDLSTPFDIVTSVAVLADSTDYAMKAARPIDAANDTGVFVGIPAYNEAATIGSVVTAAMENADEVVVLDDGSTDGTSAIAESSGATVITFDQNRGKGRAVAELFDFARTGDWEYFVCLDADWQHDPHEIPRLVEPLRADDADVIIGSRYVDGDGSETPAYRRVGQRVLDRLTASGSGLEVSDSQSGFRAFNRRAIEAVQVRDTGFGVESQTLTTIGENGLRVEEVPIRVRYDVPSPNSDNPVWHGMSVVDAILRVVRDQHPLLFFGVPGLVLTGFGLGYGVWTVSIYQTQGNFFVGKALLATITFIVGLLSVYSALIMNLVSNRLERVV